MLSFEKLVEKENLKVRESYRNSLEKIKNIWEDLKYNEDKFQQYLFAIADKILFFAELEKEINDEYYRQNNLEALQHTNQKFLTVKTLSASHPDKGYAQTKEFYKACGFMQVEEFKELWSIGHPCLFMVKAL